MFTLFRRKKVSPLQAEAATPPPLSATLLQPSPGVTLLGSPRRQKLLEHIWQRTSLSRGQFAVLYQVPIERYAALVQQFPASEYHHHAYHGGMLDHALESVGYALKLRQSYLLPVGATPETQSAQSEAWTTGVAYGALLHDLGKIAVDLHVEYGDGTAWHAWHGVLKQPYRFRYRQERSYRLHGAATGLLYASVLGQQALDWLHGFPELWSALLYVLAGQYENAGILGELVIQADRASVAQELGGNPQHVHTAPKQALQRKLLDGLRYLIKEQLKLNQPEASDGWLTQEALWLVSKTVCDKLRAHLLSHGAEGIPDSNTAVFNVLQDHGIAQATADGKAIWKATVTSASGWTHSFTFLRIAPSLIWEPRERPPPFDGTVRSEDAAPEKEPAQTGQGRPSTDSANVRFSPTSESFAENPISPDPASAVALDAALSLLAVPAPGGSNIPASAERFVAGETNPAQAVPPATPDTAPEVKLAPGAPGAQFITWLRTHIQLRRLVINDAKALVHTVDGTAFLVSPGIFQRYVQEQPITTLFAKGEGMADWVWVQKKFERERLHRKQRNGLNIWTCAVTGRRKTRRLHGYLLLDPSTIFSEVPFDNPYVRLLNPASSNQDEAA